METKTEVVTEYVLDEVENHVCGNEGKYERKIVWGYCLLLSIFHLLGLYGMYETVYHAKYQTLIYSLIVWAAMGEGILLGAHRLYCHKAFKAAKSVQIAMLFLISSTGQLGAYQWALTHRMHHKYCDTDADPMNPKRGFFFSHFGWMLVEPHPMVMEKIDVLDLSDITSDELVMFQHRNKWTLTVLAMMATVLPPVLLWNETLWVSFFAMTFRVIVVFNLTMFMNSLAHSFGTQPYDKRMSAKVSDTTWWMTLGDGWHNFHHCFPWDYRLQEFGFNAGLTTLLIDLLAHYGLVTDRKIASREVIAAHEKKWGDGSLDTHKLQVNWNPTMADRWKYDQLINKTE